MKLPQTIAHQIGHGLNMGHDYSLSSSDARTCPTDQSSCTGIGGVLDIGVPFGVSSFCDTLKVSNDVSLDFVEMLEIISRIKGVSFLVIPVDSFFLHCLMMCLQILYLCYFVIDVYCRCI